MRAQIFNDYFRMQNAGLVPSIKCIDTSHGRLFVRVLDDDIIELFCLGCDYKIRPGLKYYQTIIEILSLHDVNYLKELMHG